MTVLAHRQMLARLGVLSKHPLTATLAVSHAPWTSVSLFGKLLHPSVKVYIYDALDVTCSSAHIKYTILTFERHEVNSRWPSNLCASYCNFLFLLVLKRQTPSPDLLWQTYFLQRTSIDTLTPMQTQNPKKSKEAVVRSRSFSILPFSLSLCVSALPVVVFYSRASILSAQRPIITAINTLKILGSDMDLIGATALRNFAENLNFLVHTFFFLNVKCYWFIRPGTQLLSSARAHTHKQHHWNSWDLINPKKRVNQSPKKNKKQIYKLQSVE